MGLVEGGDGNRKAAQAIKATPVIVRYKNFNPSWIFSVKFLCIDVRSNFNSSSTRMRMVLHTKSFVLFMCKNELNSEAPRTSQKA